MEKEKKIENEVKRIYEEVNEKYNLEDIYTEGFTSEQVYYQVEGLVKRVLEEREKKVQKLYEKFLRLPRSHNNIEDSHNNIKDGIEDSQKEEGDSQDYNDDHNKDYNKEEEGDSQNISDDSEAFERYKNDLEETEEDEEEEDEDTLSDEGSIEDPEDLKDMPACDLFKRLDKNVYK